MQKNQLLLQQKKINEKKLEIVQGLPHLYGRKWYAWARSFFNSTNKMNLLCAANQISKSSTLIRKAIEHSTNQKLWPIIWPHIWPENDFIRPNFWYMYPSAEVATNEFDMKWVPEFLPRNGYRTDSFYGWEEEKEKGIIKAIRWRNGASLQFKFYTQDLSNLQTATVHEIFGDEEMPENMYPEFAARLIATRGPFNMVFTATLGEMLWYRAMECIGQESEAFPDAFKQMVSMYDCLKYDDGTDTPWTEEIIQDVIKSCSSEAEVKRRVFGRFVKEQGLKYAAFSPDRHFVKPVTIGSDRHIYTAVDIGGGGTGHPAAIAFVAVRPDFKHGFVFRGWRGGSDLTTSGDILDKFRELRGSLKCSMQIYDQQAKDFGTVAARQSESFVKAEKSHELGEDIINTLFKNDMLEIFDIPELHPLGSELISLNKATPKQKAKDDFCDALRYAVTQVPWDFTAIKGFVPEGEKKEEEARPLTDAEYLALEIEERRGTVKKKNNDSWNEFDDEIASWNEEYGT